jgi:Glycosyl hydrolases family 25
MTILGIDISHHQGTINWPTVARSDAGFALVKISEGASFTDPSGRSNLAAARTAGLIPGGYHFLRPGDGAAQCDRFLSLVGDPGGVLLAVDVETDDIAADPGVVREFLLRFAQRLPGRRALVYSNHGLYHAHPIADLGVAVAWHAGDRDGHYTAATGTLSDQWSRTTIAPTPFAGFTTFPLIQFTDHAIVPGAGSVDGSAWLATLAELASLAGGTDMPITTADVDLLLREPLQRHVDETHADVSDRLTVGEAIAGQTIASAALAAQSAANGAALSALSAKIDGITISSGGALDLDLLAAKVADLLAARLAS